MKIYEGDGEGGLVGVTKAGREYWLSGRTTSSIFVSEGNQGYVLVKGGERSAWKLEDGTFVDLFNTHCTGELRWSEPTRCGDDRYRQLSPHALLAAQHFGVQPTTLTPEEWQEAIDSYKIRIEDLSEVEVDMLKEAAQDRDGTGSFSEVRGEGSIPQSSAMYDLHRKGLVDIGGSGGSGGKSTQLYYITRKGRTILKDGKA